MFTQGSWTLYLSHEGEEALSGMGFYVPPKSSIKEPWIGIGATGVDVGENRRVIMEAINTEPNPGARASDLHVQVPIPPLHEYGKNSSKTL